MIRNLILALTLATLAIVNSPAAADWAFKQSYYSHDPNSGRHIAQHSSGETPYARVDPNFQQSAYRHQRVRLGGPGGSADNIHIVETWGDGENIRPYGEWLRPYRAGATPYGPWGNPQGPWTLPFESWVNPYGLGQLPYPPYPYYPHPPMPLDGHGGNIPPQGHHGPGGGPGEHGGHGGHVE